jgi:hypothetical protein
MKSTYTIFDIETGPLDRKVLEKLLPPFNRDEVKLGNAKDPEKVNAIIEAAQAKYEENFYSKAALSATTGEVLALGMLSRTGASEYHDIFDREVSSERKLIQRFWAIFEDIITGVVPHRHLVGHCIFDFDLPFLVRRSWAIGLQVPTMLYTRRGGRIYWNEIFIDTRAEFLLGQSWNGPESNLGAVARFCGSQHCKTDDGAQFYLLWHDKKTRSQARQYLGTDLKLTQDPFRVMRPDLTGNEGPDAPLEIHYTVNAEKVSGF